MTMEVPEELLNGLSPGLTLRFFATFARFEFALKYTGCLQHQADGSVAMASRVALRNRLPPNFFEAVRNSGNAEELIARPPRKLVVRALASPEFGAAPAPATDTLGLLDAIWNVRNNLFHGNKMSPANRERDAALMSSALAVIQAVLDIDTEISSAFYEPQQFI